VLGALDRLADGGRAPLDIAQAAHAVETIHLGRQSGVQDQLCSVFGGANFIEITDYPRGVVTPLALSDTMRRDLQRRLPLIYLGRPHSSSAKHQRVMRDLEQSGADCAPLDAFAPRRTLAGRGARRRRRRAGTRDVREHRGAGGAAA
jgi:D-glycero-alpha-D-manno-heptose-7-phosphate kinase